MSARKAKKPHLRLVSNNKGPLVAPEGLAVNIKAPDDEKVIVKEIPAKVDGVEVGTAQIYEDGSIGVIINEDAPQWAKDKIKSEADKIGFSLEKDL